MYTHTRAYTHKQKTKRTNNWTVSNELNEIIEPIQKNTHSKSEPHSNPIQFNVCVSSIHFG